MDDEPILYAADPPIATITLNRPDRLNALTVPAWDGLKASLEEADSDPDIRVIILEGAGKAFSSGDDIGDFDIDTPREARAYSRHIMACGLTIERIETPVIAKVDGLAVGGGCELAVLPDVTIASESAEFGLPEARVGAVPGIGLVRFPELIGIKQSRELMLTGRRLSAAEAKEIGLVNEVVPPEDLDDVVAARAADIVKAAPMSTRLIKRILNSRLEDEAAAVNALTLIFSMEDAKEGMDAFFEKREPEWRDR